VEPPRELLFKKRINLLASVREIWARRELIFTLAERDLRVRYKQTILGFLWSIIVPLFLVLVFSVFLERVVNFDTGGTPYILFAFIGLIPWTSFSVSVNQGGQSIVNNSSLLNKVYCPREAFPIASITVASFDAVISTLVLCVLFVITGVAPKVTSLWIPVLIAVQFTFTLGVVFVVSAIVVFVRDLRQALPLMLQLGLFATPVAYPVPLSPSFELLYSVLNPLAPVINGYRRAILFGVPPQWELVALAAASALVWLLGGYALFKKLEVRFADFA
jgi:ABC-2 type transport system permease protein/lipopolysaccharide transport system permease protein